MKYTIQELKERGLIIYEYVRGSTCQGINTSDSDIDIGGIYMCPVEDLLGLNIDYMDEVSDERHDVCYLELNKFMKLLLTSNPTVLEALFVDDKFVRIEHPAITELKKHKEKFLTKGCFKPFFGYATSQIAKARGLNKKIVNPIEKRLWPLDFCYTNDAIGTNNGSIPIRQWLEKYGLEQKYCGLQSINNMPGCYYLYYDLDAHIMEKKPHMTLPRLCQEFVLKFKVVKDGSELIKRIFENDIHPIGYRGIVLEDGKSDDIRFSSIPKGEKPICLLYYNLNAFQHHCKEYKDYQDWILKRNPVRYESNLTKNYDAKNMAHCFRLVNTAIEIAQGKGYRVNRQGIDADFLLDIRNHKYEYDDLIFMLEERKKLMEQVEKFSTIPDKVDINFLNNIVLKIRGFR